MRAGLILLLLAALAAAQGRPVPSKEQVEEVRKIVGDEDWGRMPEWRRRSIVHRYLRYLGAPAEVRSRLAKKGLKQFLTKPRRSMGKRELPPELAKELDALDPGIRRLAGKLAVVRLRQLRFDRNLSMLPRAERRRWFDRLFPEPFDMDSARKSRLKFERVVARSVAERLKPKLSQLRDLPDEERRQKQREFVRAHNKTQEDKVLRDVARQVRKLHGVKPEHAQRRLSGEAWLVLDRRGVFATPRQRELIRWSLRPSRCPLLDLGWMGKRPDERGARRQWDRDVHILGRLELLSDAGLPAETVLHLAAAGSDEEFMRTLEGLVGPGPRRGRDPSAEVTPGARPTDRRK